MLRDIKRDLIAAARSYPLKRRAFNALLVFLMLLLAFVKDWHPAALHLHLVPWKTIAIIAFPCAWLFERGGRWNMFLLGVGIGDALLYALK